MPSGAKPFMYEVCGRSFTYSSHLVYHQWYHAAGNGLEFHVSARTVICIHELNMMFQYFRPLLDCLTLKMKTLTTKFKNSGNYRCGRKNSPIWEGHSFGWGARRRTAVYVPFSVYTVAWSGEHRAFIVEEFIKNGGSPVATQRAFRIRCSW
jgi:hypothetical protein